MHSSEEAADTRKRGDLKVSACRESTHRSASRRPSGLRSRTLPVLIYLAAAVVYTWPIVLHPRTRLAAPVGPGDPYLNLWILGWGMRTVVTDPLAVLSGRVFNANIFYPADGTLAYSDHLLLQSVVLAPLYAITRDVVLCYNVLLLLSLAASGVAMHAFVRGVAGSTGGACLAGLAWAFWPYRFSHLLHLQLQSLYFLPLAFLLLHRVIAGRRPGDAVWLGVVAGLQAISSVYYAIIGAISLAVGAVTLAIAVGRWRSSVIARRLITAGVVAAALVLPVVLAYWRVQQSAGFGRNLFEASRNAAQVSSYVQVPQNNLLYGRTGLLRYDPDPSADVPRTGPERELFPGVVIVLLAAAGVVLTWKGDARPLVLTMLVVGTTGFVLSLGPAGFRSLYAILHRFVFGFQVIRAPARFAVLTMFALATLAALGWRELSSHAHRPRRAQARSDAKARPYGVILILLAAIEFVNVPVPTTPAPSRRTDVGQWLHREPGPGAVAHLPLGLDVESTPAMVQSLEHWRPIVNGYSGQRPDFYTALVDTLDTFPADDALVALKELGVRFVVTEKAAVPAGTAATSPLVERARFPDGVIYELRWTPEIDRRLNAAQAVTVPPPGPPPFGTGETATYAVQWSGAAMDVSAGEVTIAVQQPDYTFKVTAVTAPWVATFFEARDVFLTRADPQLLPQLHERDQREGSRHVSRTFVYDHANGVVHLGKNSAHALSSEGVTLPLSPSARDAISALFYARTLPLEPGTEYVIPVNEAGRNLVVDVPVVGRESINVHGKILEALRLEPRIRRRAERRQPVTGTVWLSTDERRVPVAMNVDAAFGRLRLELVSYQTQSAVRPR